MDICAIEGCQAPVIKPGDKRYRYCKVHQDRKVRRKVARPVLQCQHPGCIAVFKPEGPGLFRYCPDHRGTGTVILRPLPEWRRRIPAGLVGTIHGVQVAIDLILKGYDVWQAIGGHCPCRIIAGIKQDLLRVEVTTGQWTVDRRPRLIHPHSAAVKRHDRSRWDVLAIVTDSEIIYEPPLPTEYGISSVRFVQAEKIDLATTEGMGRVRQPGKKTT